MSTNNYIKPLVFIVIINLISVVLGGLFLQSLNIGEQTYVLPVVVAVITFIFALHFFYRFFQTFELLVHQFKKLESGGQKLNVKGNQVVEQNCQIHNLLSQKYDNSAN